MDTAHLAPLATFRAATYAAFGRRRDALFELCDTLLTTGLVPSLPFLSVQPQHQRRWGSLYDAPAVGEMSVASLEWLLADYPLANGEPIFAVDTSVCRAAMPRPAPSAPYTIMLRAIRRDNLSSRAEPIRGSPRLASHARAGRRPCACGGYAPKRTAT